MRDSAPSAGATEILYLSPPRPTDATAVLQLPNQRSGDATQVFRAPVATTPPAAKPSGTHPPVVAERPAPPVGGRGLPEPPITHGEKYAYAKRYLWILILASCISLPCLAITEYGFVVNSERMLVFAPFLALTPLLGVSRVVMDAFTRNFDLDAHNALVRHWRPAHYPSVDVFLPTCGEPVEILHNTWTYVTEMRQHYQGVLRVYVLDDADRSELRRMAAAFGFDYLVRPHRGWNKKSGNLYHGLNNSGGEFILILDADFVPRYDFLDETLPYMAADPKIGLLQTPQYFRISSSDTWVARGANAVQELFYRAIQVARDQNRAVVCCGSCAVYRREALEANGGIALLSHSEDIYTGMGLRRLGWSVRYIPLVLSAGLCPDTIVPFYKQQYRWCMGTLSIIRGREFWLDKIPWRARVSELSGFLFYVETAVFVLLLPTVGIVLCTSDVRQVNLFAYLFIVPSLIHAFVINPLWHRCSYGADAWAVRIVYGWSHIFAILDTLRGREMGWEPTGSRNRRGNTRLYLALWLWSGTTAFAWLALAAWRMLTYDTLAFAPVFVTAAFFTMLVVRVLIPAKPEFNYA
jgi:cellulose synthase (UDP-forming)